MAKKQRKTRLWLAVIGVGVVLVGLIITLLAIAGLVDAFTGGDATGYGGGAFSAVVAATVLALGIWIIRVSGVPVGDALNW